MANGKSPFFWSLFSAGGTVSALLFPAHLFLFGIALPAGWLAGPGYEDLHALVRHPFTRLYLFVFVALPLFHWAHRFRYTLYDGLQQYHLNRFIAVLCYGIALAGTVFAAVLLATFP
jgi:fumarate reductase subunit D